MLRLHHRVQNSPWSLGVSSPNSCTLPAHGLGDEEQKRPLLCVRAAQQELKPHGDTNFVFSTNPNHNPIPATRKKIISVPAKSAHHWCLKESVQECLKKLLGKYFVFFPGFFFSSFIYLLHIDPSLFGILWWERHKTLLERRKELTLIKVIEMCLQ